MRVRVCAFSYNYVMCVQVFLGRAPGRPTGSEHSSAQTCRAHRQVAMECTAGAWGVLLRLCGRAQESTCACARGKMHAHGCCAFARTGDSSVSRRTTCAISSSSVSQEGTFFHEMGERMRTQSCTCAGVHTCTNTHTHTPRVCACPLYLPARTPKHRLAARRRHNLCTC